jgi:hypothetical protein
MNHLAAERPIADPDGVVRMGKTALRQRASKADLELRLSKSGAFGSTLPPPSDHAA